MKVPKMKTPPPPPENSMAQANANYDRWKDARNVHKAFAEFINRHMPDGIKIHKPNMYKEEELIAFAKFYAQRCGVVLDGNSEIPNNH